MSWSVFRSRCMVLTGQQHVSRIQFAQTIASAYNECILMHFDTLTGGGKVVNSALKMPILFQGILSVCEQNMYSDKEVNFLQQLGPHFKAFWPGIIITGPLGVTTVTSAGVWNGIYVKQNFNFQIILNLLMVSARAQIMTLTGTYVSSVVPGVTSPWSGAMLQTLP